MPEVFSVRVGYIALPTELLSHLSVRAGDITNGYDSLLLNTTVSTWRGDSPEDPCYEVGEIQSTTSKTYILLVI